MSRRVARGAVVVLALALAGCALRATSSGGPQPTPPGDGDARLGIDAGVTFPSPRDAAGSDAAVGSVESGLLFACDAAPAPGARDATAAAAAALRACALYLGCVGGPVALGDCAEALARAPRDAAGYLAEHAGQRLFGFGPDSDLAHFDGVVALLTAPAVRACLEDAAECAAVFRCVAGGGPASEESRCDAPALACDGDTLRGCVRAAAGDARRFAFDCASAGSHCVDARASGSVEEPAQIGCAPGACAPGAAPSARCAGGAAIARCVSGLADRAPCAPGLECAEIGGVARCQGDGGACEPIAYRTHCEGDALVACVGGREAARACGDVGGCRDDGAGHAVCAAPDACAPAGAAACDAASGQITSCVAGGRARVDCTALGFAGCASAGCPPVARCR